MKNLQLVKKVGVGLMAALVTVLLQSGCATVAKTAAQIGQTTGVMTADQAESLVKTGEAFGKAFEQITPEQEYYVGRAVGATIISTYKVYDNEVATRYVNLIGQTMGMVSDKPETFGGYHFLILDSDEINAFAAPGGLIFLSRGMLRLCKNEDQLAGVLAHEVAHVNLGHAISAISNSRWTQAFTILGAEGAKSFGGEQLKLAGGAPQIDGADLGHHGAGDDPHHHVQPVLRRRAAAGPGQGLANLAQQKAGPPRRHCHALDHACSRLAALWFQLPDRAALPLS